MYIHMFHPGRKSPVKQNERNKRQIQPKQWRISSRRDGYVRISLWPFLGRFSFFWGPIHFLEGTTISLSMFILYRFEKKIIYIYLQMV